MKNKWKIIAIVFNFSVGAGLLIHKNILETPLEVAMSTFEEYVIEAYPDEISDDDILPKADSFYEDINIEDNSWLIGEWAPDEEDFAVGEILTFKGDGTFSFGDDCFIKGTYTIKENIVYLKGTVDCYGDVENYSETITIQGNRLKGYRKL